MKSRSQIMHAPRRPLLLLLLGLALGACSGIAVTTDYDPKSDFSAFQTWAFHRNAGSVDGSGSPDSHDLVSERIRSAIRDELSGKGMRLVATDDASLLVQTRVSVGQRLQFNDPYYAYDRVSTYEEGTLVIDLVDRATDKIVWRGTGQTRLRQLKSPEEREARVRDVVKAILSSYPPKGEGK